MIKINYWSLIYAIQEIPFKLEECIIKRISNEPKTGWGKGGGDVWCPPLVFCPITLFLNFHCEILWLWINNNLKDLEKNLFLLMRRVEYRAVKSPVCLRKSKMAHSFFLTKATDLKTVFLKSPWKMSWPWNMHFNPIPFL